MIHTVKGFGIVNNAEVDVFLELSSFFDDLIDVGNLIFGSSVDWVSHSVVSDSFRPPQTVAHQASLSMQFSRQEYWSELPFPSTEELSNPGIEPY